MSLHTPQGEQERSIINSTSGPFLNLFSNMVFQSSGSLLTVSKAGQQAPNTGFLKYALTLYTYNFNRSTKSNKNLHRGPYILRPHIQPDKCGLTFEVVLKWRDTVYLDLKYKNGVTDSWSLYKNGVTDSWHWSTTSNMAV